MGEGPLTFDPNRATPIFSLFRLHAQFAIFSLQRRSSRLSHERQFFARRINHHPFQYFFPLGIIVARSPTYVQYSPATVLLTRQTTDSSRECESAGDVSLCASNEGEDWNFISHARSYSCGVLGSDHPSSSCASDRRWKTRS